MNRLETTGARTLQPGDSFAARSVPIAAGLTSIALTSAAFMFGTGAWPLAVAGVIAAAYVAICLFFAPVNPVDAKGPTERLVDDQITPADLEDRLTALDEANEFFATSLGAHDMFRLVASRVSEIFPFAACCLAVPDETGQILRFLYADGENAESLREFEFQISDGLAGRAFSSGRIEIERRMLTDLKCLGSTRIEGFTSAAAIPLLENGEPFAVFELFMDSTIDPGPAAAVLLERIRDHVTQIFRSSLAFERSLSNALTDPLTGLPNERAFYMVLENQLAESLRHRDDRPLTVLSIDIRDFGAVNSMLGHATGDRMLEFAAARIGEHLRKMDFLARTVNDEFNVILPTATEKVGLEIIERIKAGFAGNEFEISHGEGVSIALNIGWSTFWKDGETAQQLIRAAQQRKREAKCESPSGVLWFPREYVN